MGPPTTIHHRVVQEVEVCLIFSSVSVEVWCLKEKCDILEKKNKLFFSWYKLDKKIDLNLNIKY